jgi:hypothetical protein
MNPVLMTLDCCLYNHPILVVPVELVFIINNYLYLDVTPDSISDIAEIWQGQDEVNKREHCFLKYGSICYWASLLPSEMETDTETEMALQNRKRVSEALSDLSRRTEVVHELMQEAGWINICVRLLSDPNIEVLQAALLTVLNLSENYTNIQEDILTKVGVMQPLMKLLLVESEALNQEQHQDRTRQTHQYLLQTIWNLSSTSINQHLIGKAGSIPSLVRFLSPSVPIDQLCRRLAVNVLSNLAGYRDNQDLIRDANGIQALWCLYQLNIESSSALRTLMNLTYCHTVNQQVLHDITENDVITPLFHTLSSSVHINEISMITQYAAGLLWHLSFDRDIAEMMIRQEGMIEKLIQLLPRAHRLGRMRLYVSGCLCNLFYYFNQTCYVYFVMEGSNCLREELIDRLLVYSADKSTCWSSGAILHALYVIQGSHECQTIREDTFGVDPSQALTNLILNPTDTEPNRLICDPLSKVIPYMILLSNENVEVRKKASFAVMEMAKSEHHAQEIFRQVDGIAVLSKLLSDLDCEVCFNAEKTLDILRVG